MDKKGILSARLIPAVIFIQKNQTISVVSRPLYLRLFVSCSLFSNARRKEEEEEKEDGA